MSPGHRRIDSPESLNSYVLRITLAALLLAVPLSACAQTRIWSFVDPDGVLHLSNVEEDRRIQAAMAEAALARHRSDEERANDPWAQRTLRYRSVIERAAVRFNIDSALLHAVIAVESAFDPRALSARGAGGLMQLTAATARRYGVADVFDPADNVRGGAQYLSDLLKLFDNDLSLTLAAYNAGEGAVLNHGKRIPPFRETVAYVPKVIAAYEKYRAAR